MAHRSFGQERFRFVGCDRTTSFLVVLSSLVRSLQPLRAQPIGRIFFVSSIISLRRSTSRAPQLGEDRTLLSVRILGSPIELRLEGNPLSWRSYRALGRVADIHVTDHWLIEHIAENLT